MPGGSAMKLKTPRSFETAVWGRMSASLASVTETPGRTAFCSSVTTPVIVPVWICAAARDGTDSNVRAAKSPRVVLTVAPSRRFQLGLMTLPPCLAASCFSVWGEEIASQRLILSGSRRTNLDRQTPLRAPVLERRPAEPRPPRAGFFRIQLDPESPREECLTSEAAEQKLFRLGQSASSWSAHGDAGDGCRPGKLLHPRRKGQDASNSATSEFQPAAGRPGYSAPRRLK